MHCSTIRRIMPGVFLSCLLICLGSGVILAFQYQPLGGEGAMRSVEEITTLIPYGFFFRRLHFVSGQLCAAAALIHAGSYLMRKAYGKTPPVQWIRLVAGLGICLLLLLTGFILKGDGEGIRAGTILSGLLGELPLIGARLSSTAVGHGENFFMPPYLLHCLILPPALLLLLGSHIRKWFPGPEVFCGSVLCLGTWSLFIPMALPIPPGTPDTLSTGPWLFLGMQALLMHLPPLLCVLAAAGWFTLLCALPLFTGRSADHAHRLLIASTTTYAALCVGFMMYVSMGP